MNETTDVLILKQQDYRERDVIVTVLSRDYGKISFIASGARKMTSKNAGSLLPYMLSEFTFDYKPDKTMFRLRTARTKKLYRRIHEDLTISAAAGVASEAVDALTMQTGDDLVMFELLEKCLDALQEGKDAVTVLTVFLSDAMNHFGAGADVDECVHCGRTNVVFFSAKEGGFLCRQHAELLGYPIQSSTDLKRMRLLVKGGLSHLDLILETGGAQAEDLYKIVTMVRLHTGIALKSYDLFSRLY